MTREELNNTQIKQFEISQKRAHEKMAQTKEILDLIKDGVHSFADLARENKRTQDSKLIQYRSYLDEELQKINIDHEKVKFLLEEKHKNKNEAIDAKIRRDGFDRKHFEDCIEFAIDPFLKQVEEKIDYLKKFPVQYQISSTATESKPIYHNDEITKANSKPNIESVFQKYYETPRGIKRDVLSSNENYTDEILLASELNDGKYSNTTTGVTEELSVAETDAKKTDESPAELIPPLSEEFEQIICKATKEQILNYFMVLTKAVNPKNKKPYMLEEDVVKMVKKNFAIFDCVPTGEYFYLNLTKRQKGIIRYFIYEFYQKYEGNYKDTKNKYALFLIHNFELFMGDKLTSVTSNMCSSDEPPEHKKIDIRKFGIN